MSEESRSEAQNMNPVKGFSILTLVVVSVLSCLAGGGVVHLAGGSSQAAGVEPEPVLRDWEWRTVLEASCNLAPTKRGSSGVGRAACRIRYRSVEELTEAEQKGLNARLQERMLLAVGQCTRQEIENHGVGLIKRALAEWMTPTLEGNTGAKLEDVTVVAWTMTR